MSEAQEAPVADPVAEIPTTETSGEFSEFSFEQALESSINQAEASTEPAEKTTEPEPAKEAEKPAEVEAKPTDAESTETESTEAEPTETDTSDTSDILESIEADVGEDWTPKASSAFQKLKASNKALAAEKEQIVQRAREAEAKVAELEGVVGNATVETLQNRVQEYEQAQMVSNLEATDAYRDAIISPLEKIFMGVEKLAEDHGADYQDLVDAISIEDAHAQEERVAEILATASDRDKATFYRLAAEVDPILQRRDALRENASEALKEAELAAEEAIKKEAAVRAGERVNVTKNVTQRISDKVPFLSGFEDLDMEKISQEASSVDPSVVHPVDFAYQAVAARLIPPLVKEYASAQKLIDELTKQLASYEDAEPKLSGGSNPTALAGSTSGTTNFAESIEAALSGT